MTPEAGGPIRQLAYTVDEADAMALIALAVQRGANPDEARDAWSIWLQIRHGDITTLEAHGMTTEHLCRCSHVHGEGRCWSRSCGCTVLRSTKAATA